eukprot:1670670-Amphidinium_carterae.1
MFFVVFWVSCVFLFRGTFGEAAVVQFLVPIVVCLPVIARHWAMSFLRRVIMSAVSSVVYKHCVLCCCTALLPSNHNSEVSNKAGCKLNLLALPISHSRSTRRRSQGRSQ